MFCNQCEEALNGKGCTAAGICGKPARVSDLQDKLIYATKGLAYYAKNADLKEVNEFILESLFVTITNVNFDDKSVESYIKKAIELRGKFSEDENAPDAAKISFEDLMETEIGPLTIKNEDTRSLVELLVLGLKGLAAYAYHAEILDYKDNKISRYVNEALAATLDHDNADLLGLIMKCGEMGVATMALLDEANTKTFGTPAPREVQTTAGEKPGILVSGHELLDLKNLLEQTKNQGIDIYTHGEMLPAHGYPELNKYPHLKGNYGSSWWHQKEEFEKFNGPILMTTNCIVPPSDSYKDKIYTRGPVAFPETKHIEGDNFTEIIEHAKKCQPPTKITEHTLMTGFGHGAILENAETIINAVKDGAIKKFVVMAGCDGRHKERSYYEEFAKKLPKDTVILTAGCAKYRYNSLDLGSIGPLPRVIDAGQCNDSFSLVKAALALKEAFELDDINDLPIAYNIAWYEQKAVLVLLVLLHLGVKNIMLGPKLPAFVSPNVLTQLVEMFGIQPNSTVEEDLQKLI